MPTGRPSGWWLRVLSPNPVPSGHPTGLRSRSSGGRCTTAIRGNADIYTVGVDARGAVPLVSSSGWDTGAAWSPDGSRIAFSSERDGDEEIYVVNFDGSGEQKLTELPGVDATTAAWSPDGTQISLVAHDGEQWDDWVVNADGSGLKRLTPSDRDDGPAVWAPDGSLLAFTASEVTGNVDNTGTYDVYTIRPDGTGERRITSGGFAMGWDLSWQPVPATEATSTSSPQIDASTVDIGHGGGIDVAVGEGSVWVSTIDGVGSDRPHDRRGRRGGRDR
jgi:Tol biopolymer transport system component